MKYPWYSKKGTKSLYLQAHTHFPFDKILLSLFLLMYHLHLHKDTRMNLFSLMTVLSENCAKSSFFSSVLSD